MRSITARSIRTAAASICASGAVFAGALGVAYPAAPDSGIATIAFLDIGQGDAVFIESPEGRQLLIDAGATNAIAGVLPEIMGPFDRTIDVALATHPDADHIGGFPVVLERYRIGAVVATESRSDNGAYDAFIDGAIDEGAARVLARRGAVIRLGQRTTLRLLYPDGPVESLDPNDASIVALLEDGDVSVMLTGDAPQWVERRLVEAYGGALDVDILKAGHHGSKTSTGPEFVAATSPAIAVISAEADNRYGHPHQEVLDTLAHFGVQTVSTAHEGTIVFQSDGKRVWRKPQ